MAVLVTKVLKEERQHQSHHQPEKWMADLAIASVHLKEGNTFARYRQIQCCGTRLIYSGSSHDFFEFRIRPQLLNQCCRAGVGAEII